MSLVRGFILSMDRRTVLAVLAIAVSVSYSLVAGAAVSGLKDAQGALAEDLQDQAMVVTADASMNAFDPAGLPVAVDLGLALHEVDDRTLYTVRAGGSLPLDNQTRALVGPSIGLSTGDHLALGGHNLTVETGTHPPGAHGGWIGVSSQRFEALGGIPAPQVNTAVVLEPGPRDAQRVQAAGFTTSAAPAAVPYYEAGAAELVESARWTVLASALVVGLLATGFVHMELRARRQSFATLQLYAGPRLVQRLVVGRGIFMLAAGHLLGLGATLALLGLLDRAGAATFQLPWGYLALAVGATLVGGLVGLVPPVLRAGRRLTAGELGSQEPPPRVPRMLRPALTSWRVVLPLAVSALVLASSLGVIYGMVDLPTQLFGAEGADVIADTRGNPLRGQVSAFLGLHLAGVDGYEAASPEIFAPTTLHGRPAMVRGVSWDHLAGLDPVRLVSGSAPERPGEAVIGDRLAARLDIGVGDRLVVPASYAPTVVGVQVVGVSTGGGLLADELLVPLTTARTLTGLPEDTVNIIRTRTVPVDAADGTTPATGAPRLPSGIEVRSLALSPRDPVALEPVTARLQVTNFADQQETRRLTLQVNGQARDDAWVELGPRASTTVELSFRMPSTPEFVVEVNPRIQGQPAQEAYRLEAREAAAVNSTMVVRVFDGAGDPAPGVTVALDDSRTETGPDGRAQVTPAVLGNRTVVASGPDGRSARSVLVVEPSDLHRARIELRDVNGPTRLTGGAWEGVIEVENVGGRAFRGMLTVPVNGTPTNVSELTLVSGGTTRLPFRVSLPDGVHTIGTGAPALQVTVGAQASGPGDGGEDGGDGGDGTGQGATLEELLERRRAQARQSTSARADATSAFLGDTVENVESALTIVTLATVLHAGLVTAVAVFRETEERAPTVATLAAVGAERRALRGWIIREYLLVGTAAALVGAAAGLALAWAGAQAGLLSGFGHVLSPRGSPGFLLRLAAGALVTTLLAAVFAVEQAAQAPTGRLLTHGPRRSQRPPLDALLEESA